MIPLTPRQQQVLDFIRRTFVEEQRMPSLREIAESVGIRSPNGIVCHLRALQKKGLIRLERHRARSIRLLKVRVVLEPIE